MARFDLTDFEWELIRPLLPNKPRGVARVDDRAVLDLIAAHGGRSHIPTQRNRKVQRSVEPAIYRQRNLVERFFNKLKHFRKIATRIASTRIWIRFYGSAS